MERGTTMQPIKDAASDFLSHKRVAVTGVSRNGGSHGSNAVYQRLRERGYEVFAVNPQAQEVEGDTAYPDLKSIPGGVETVVIGTRPERAQATVEECAELGIKQVWMHRGPGGGSVSQDAAVDIDIQPVLSLQGRRGVGPRARDDGHRRRLPAHVRTDLGHRPQGDAVGVRHEWQRATQRLS